MVGNRVTRRRFAQIVAGSGWLAARSHGGTASRAEEEIVFGVVTDVHYCDADTQGSRYYRDSLAKLTACVDAFNTNEDSLRHSAG